MKKLFPLFLLFSSQIFAQLPNTDIWLLDIKVMKDSVSLTNPVNITLRPGYDNQPSFSPDGKYILYTSIRDEKQSDIYKYDLKTKQTSQFINTSTTSEYSPIFMPDGKNISVVMVEPDSTQRLWKFPIKGGAPSLIMDKVDSIGYHCWINKDSLALVMITEPPTLVTTNIHSQKTKLFIKNPDSACVSRCLVYNRKSGVLFFGIKDLRANRSSLPLYILNSKDILYPSNELCKPSAPHLYGDTEDFAVLNLEKTGPIPLYVFGVNSELLIADYYLTGDFILRKDYKDYGMKISRIAISPDGSKMAVVMESLDAH